MTPVPSTKRSRWFMAAFCIMVALSAAALAEVGAELVLAYRTPPPISADWKAEANADLVRRFYAETWNSGHVEDIGSFITKEHAYHDPMVADVAVGSGEMALAIRALRRAFPDLVLTLDDVVARGNQVAVRFTARGTHMDSIMGAEPSEREIETTGVAIHLIDLGLISQTWIAWDQYHLALQVGLILVPISVLAGPEGAEGTSSVRQRGRPY